MSSLVNYLATEKEKATKIYEAAVIAEASSKKIKDPQAVVDALATLGLTSADYEKAIEVEREYLHLVSIAEEEETLRDAMHQAGEKYAATVEEIKQATKDLEARKKEAAGLYDTARRDFERANDASCRITKMNSISGKKLAWQLQNILQEQKEIGKKLGQVREALQRARIDLNALYAEYERTKDQNCHTRYKIVVERIKDLSRQESELVQKSEETRDKYERTRLTRSIDGAASGDEIDGL